MALNGWRRLWVVFSALWIVAMAWQTTLAYPAGTLTEALVFGSLWTFGPPVAVYSIGFVAAWVIRGFRQTVETT